MSKKLTLFKAIAEIVKQGNLKIQIMPGVKDIPLDMPPNRPDGSVVLSPTDMLTEIEKLAPVRLVANDPIYEVLPAHLEMLSGRGFAYEIVRPASAATREKRRATAG